MRKLCTFTVALYVGLFLATSFAAEKYTGPTPPKADLPYLLHADHLIPLEVGQAKEETRKDSQVAVLPGANSPARTPLAEPIFIVKSDKLIPERLQAYRMEVKNGAREVTISHKKGKRVSRPIYLNVTRLGGNLFKVEVDEPLENGQYVLTPEGSDETFSFEIY